jgi:hypothetical protein
MMDSSGESSVTRDVPSATDVREITEDDKRAAEAEKAKANELFKGVSRFV